FSVHDGQDIEATRLQFITREMNFTQLHGRHRLNAHGGELTWSGNVSVTARDEPDTRDLVYYPQEDGRSGYKNNSGSGERFFSTLSDLAGGGTLDVTLPLRRLTFRGGAALQAQARTFDARRIG